MNIDEETCRRILYCRAVNACPGLGVSDIQRYELNDGTIVFGIDNGTRFAEYIITHNYIGAGLPWVDPEIRILVRAPWAFIAYRDGKIIDNDLYKVKIVKTLILEELLRQLSL